MEEDEGVNSTRIVVELLDENSVVIERWEGPTSDDLRVAHDTNACAWDCPFCYTEAVKFKQLAENGPPNPKTLVS